MLSEDNSDKIIPPGAFIPAAERYNISHLIDRWVIINTLEWVTSHYQQLDHVSGFSINLSALSLSNEEILEFIIQTLTESSVPSSYFCFEVTETAAIANLHIATLFFQKIKALGCQLALDDFGSGLSSFAYLKNLPVDYLKIDGVFIKDIEDDLIDQAMVKSINEIGHTMGIKTVAEWVENNQILEILKEIGIDYAQGYGLEKPQNISSIIENHN
jgi:EAL domain-containing protein (putative c-di-GMP-specific phosphodiesterase class I)